MSCDPSTQVRATCHASLGSPPLRIPTHGWAECGPGICFHAAVLRSLSRGSYRVAVVESRAAKRRCAARAALARTAVVVRLVSPAPAPGQGLGNPRGTPRMDGR